jgi:hypothetical protein
MLSVVAPVVEVAMDVLFTAAVAGFVVAFVDMCDYVVRGKDDNSTFLGIVGWFPRAVRVVGEATTMVFCPGRRRGPECGDRLLRATFHEKKIPVLDTPAALWSVIECLGADREFDGVVTKLCELQRAATVRYPAKDVFTHALPETINTDNIGAMEIEYTDATTDDPVYDVVFPHSIVYLGPLSRKRSIGAATLYLEFLEDSGDRGRHWEADKESNKGSEGEESDGNDSDGIDTTELDVTEWVKPWARGVCLRGLSALIPFILRDIKNDEPEFKSLLDSGSIISLRLDIEYMSLDVTTFQLKYRI